MSAPSVYCEVQGYQPRIKPQVIAFESGVDLCMAIEPGLGPAGLSPVGADLLDIAAAIFEVERQYGGRRRTNPPARITLKMRLRKPNVWTADALRCLGEMLYLLSGAQWEFDFSGGGQDVAFAYDALPPRHVEHVMLFSGGLDSLCGAATLSSHGQAIQLVSLYTRQKRLQQELARELGFGAPCQWRLVWARPAGRGHAFYWRSFLFLVLAAIAAESWDTRSVLQFENGILATAIPPSPAWLMTKHAYPDLHRLAERLCGVLLGGDWHMQNPFLLRTKREALQEAERSCGEARIRELAARTETCWYHWSNRVPRAKKTPGYPCGVCVPCVIRRTTLLPNNFPRDDDVRKNPWDLMDDDVRNHPWQGIAFRCYYGFLERVLQTEGSEAEFYQILPPAGRDLVLADQVSLDELHSLFVRFAGEFMETFGFRH